MENENEVTMCVWDTLAECRHPEWFKTAQEFIDSMGLSIPDSIQVVEHQFEKLKEGCKLCLIADLNRQIRLLRVTGQR